jgi:hypothetical protein
MNADSSRNNEWIDEIYPVIRKASADFKCCFVDIYNYMHDPAAYWTDEAVLHPNDTSTAMYLDLYLDFIYPRIFQATNHHIYAFSLINSWTAESGSTPGMYKDGNGIIHLTGMIKDGIYAPNTVICDAVPDAYRPAQNVIVYSGADSFVVSWNGTIWCRSVASNTLISLDGISYLAASYR